MCELEETIKITGKAYKALCGLTSNDSSRYALTSVWAKGSRLYASDAYVGARYTFYNGGIGEKAVMLNGVAAQTVKANDVVTITDADVTICDKHGASLLTLPHDDSERLRMPNFDDLFDRLTDPTADETVVNPKFMEQLTKVAKAVNGSLHINGDGLHLFGRIETDDGRIDFILMGIRKK